MVWAWGKNGWLPYGQKGVDGRSQWGMGTSRPQPNLGLRRTVRRRPRLGWMDGVKVALGNRGMTVEAARQCAKDRKAWRALVHICNWMSLTLPSLLGTVFFRTALPWSGRHHMERGGMPLHDAVGINCKKGATTENQDSAVNYMG